ncbi:MAG: SGNH/GDSL hydrolase family protein [Clostridia bacterium]|nr:SGNH/GDSL hydrolase family protein [Clostridia bacterium]
MDISRFIANEGELPLDNIVNDGGFFKIFRRVAVIGDSLSSGEFESRGEHGIYGFHDMYEYSWGQFMAREAGSTVYNWSRAGMTAGEYATSYARLMGWWDGDKDAQAYIIALGVNDFRADYPLGTIDDVKSRNTSPSFAYYLSMIIERYKVRQPNAKFFLMTTLRSEGDSPEKIKQKEAHRQLLLDLAEYYDYTYVLDLYTYAPVYDNEFRRNFYLGGHMNPQGYVFTSKIVMSYIDYIIRQNPEDFAQVGFIGKPYHNESCKW